MHARLASDRLCSCLLSFPFAGKDNMSKRKVPGGMLEDWLGDDSDGEGDSEVSEDEAEVEAEEPKKKKKSEVTMRPCNP